MNRFSSVVFDVDGTLTQTNQLIFESFNHVAGKYLHKSFSDAEVVSFFGPPEEIAIQRMVGNENAEAAIEEVHSYYKDNFSRLARLYDGIDDLLAFLKGEGVRLGVFTGKGRYTTRVTLDALGIAKYFETVVTGSDVLQHKPSGEGIRNIIQRFGVRPEELLMVGDSVSDIRAAREAGSHVAAVLWDSYGKADVLAMKPDLMFETVSGLAEWLGPRVGQNGASRR